MPSGDLTKTIATVVAAAATAAITAWGASTQATKDKVDDDVFSRAVITNCRSGNVLRSELRKTLNAFRDGNPTNEARINDAVTRLETIDCSRLVHP